jgi:SSS family transporter
MQLHTLDWVIVGAFFLFYLIVGLLVAKRSGKNYSEYFLSGRSMPWWLLGVSMVATTFSADTPNLVTDMVRKNGVAGNWAWWAFLLTGMLTVFVYAKLWRRSGVLTDLEFYELRYSGRAATFLRGFRALYLGVFFNVLIMASVSLAAIKIGGVMLGLSPLQTLLIASLVTVAYTSVGGLTGVLWTDFLQFLVAMVGTVWAAVYLLNLPQVGGLSNLLSHPAVTPRLDFLPDFSDMSVLIPVFIIPIAVQWWNVWYPGAEPGGGGYIAQRMLSAKDEKNAIGATLIFNFMHYALRPWPWILVALASLIVFPDVASLRTAFPHVDPGVVNDDLAYPAMMTYLPTGLLGMVVAALIAAYMSTIATHLNWGSSYVVHDFYRRFIKPQATDRELVNVGRLSTVVLMVLSAVIALALSNALQAFNILLQIGAGTGLIFILRWFWWRINAYSELAGMVISFVVAVGFELYPNTLEAHWKLLIGIGITTIGWVTVTLLTPPTAPDRLLDFYRHIKPHPVGWQPVIQTGLRSGALRAAEVKAGKLPTELLGMFVGVFAVYGALFGLGSLIYGNVAFAAICFLVSVVGGYLIFKLWDQLKE